MDHRCDCPQCNFVGEVDEFQEHAGDAPDLSNTYSCPECGFFWEQDE